MDKDIEIEEMNPQKHGDWNSLVEASPQGTVFHRLEWLEGIRNARHGELRLLGFYRHGNLIAGCPLIRFKKGPFDLVYSPPGTLSRFGGILFALPDKDRIGKREFKYAKVIDALTDYCRQQKFNFVSLRLHYNFEDPRPFIWDGWKSHIYYTYVSDVTDVNGIWSNISSDVRRYLKKCRQQDFQVEVDGDMEDLVKLVTATYTVKGVPWPESLPFVKSMGRLVKDKDWGSVLILKNKENQPVAGRFMVWDKRRAYGCGAGSLRDYNKYCVNEYMDWECIKLVSQRCPEMDWGGANTRSVANYKSKFNPKLVPYLMVCRKSRLFNLAENTYLYLRQLIT